jgi:hypothetical protein
MRRIVLIVLVCAATGFLLSRGERAPTRGDEPPNKVGEFMRGKLDHANRLLEGIAIGDFDLIAKHADRLRLLSLESNWKVLQTSDYVQHSIDFRRAIDAIADAAEDKNLDGAALAYVDMTMRCVACHKHVRDVRMAAVPRLRPDLAGFGN